MSLAARIPAPLIVVLSVLGIIAVAHGGEPNEYKPIACATSVSGLLTENLDFTDRKNWVEAMATKGDPIQDGPLISFPESIRLFRNWRTNQMCVVWQRHEPAIACLLACGSFSDRDIRNLRP